MLTDIQRSVCPSLSKQIFLSVPIGEVTDIVEKEMYTFDDRNGESLTLRPEGTASCVRAGEEHGLLFNQTQRLWYQGQCFAMKSLKKGVIAIPSDRGGNFRHG